MASSRKYWTVEQLTDDIRDNRKIETELELRSRTELNPSPELFRDLTTARLRIEASKCFLDKLKIDS